MGSGLFVLVHPTATLGYQHLSLPTVHMELLQRHKEGGRGRSLEAKRELWHTECLLMPGCERSWGSVSSPVPLMDQLVASGVEGDNWMALLGPLGILHVLLSLK